MQNKKRTNDKDILQGCDLGVTFQMSQTWNADFISGELGKSQFIFHKTWYWIKPAL